VIGLVFRGKKIRNGQIEMLASLNEIVQKSGICEKIKKKDGENP